jgi:hypothetical protein
MLGSNIDTVGWPKCGEIDIMEMIGGGEDRDDSHYGTLHWDANGHAQTGPDRVELPDPQILADDYHVFEIEWDRSYVIWKRDGVEFGRSSIDVNQWPTMSEFHEDFFIVLNVAVGGNWPGSPNATTPFPQQMRVDWVRVYRAGVAPSFSTHPASQTVTVGQDVTLRASASGDPSPTYQWRKDGMNIDGATGSTFSLANAGFADAGAYTVVATNALGAVTSNAATISVVKAVPTITWTLPAFLVEGAALGATELNASADVPGTFVYDPPSGTVLAVGTHDLSVTFNPSDSTHFATVSVSRTLVIAPPRPSTFDAAGYLAHNPDVAAAIGDVPDKLDRAWVHYYSFGVLEGRTDGDFNVSAYLAQYPGLAAHFGSDLKGAALHWYTTGRQTGLRIPEGFDVSGYFARNLDIASYFANDKYGAWLHYYHFGLLEGRSFDTNFIAAEYLELNPDLKAAGVDLQGAVMHWLSYGHPIEDRMGRVPIGFNVDNYLARYPDLAAAFAGATPVAVRNVAVWQHFLDYGAAEGRSDGDFDVYSYLASNPDVAIAVNNSPRDAALHWFFYGRREGRRIPAGFNVHNYRALYPDLVVFAGDDLYGCWLHYRDVGILEGRIYDETFRPADYLALNPDVAAVVGDNFRDALLHWLFYGQYEGRAAKF